MTLAGRIHALISGLGLLAGMLLCLFIGHREYHHRLDAIALRAATAVASKPALQSAFFFSSALALEDEAQGFLELSPAVGQVTLFDSLGDELAAQRSAWAASAPRPSLATLRRGLPPAKPGLVTEAASVTPPDVGLLSLATFGERTHQLTLPIVSAVDPTLDISRERFADLLVNASSDQRPFVIGYLHLGVSSGLVVREIMPTVVTSAGLGLVFVLFCLIVARITTNRITAPLKRVASAAEKIAAGESSETLPVEGTREIRDIATVFNGVIAGIHQHRKQMRMDSQLLRLKVTERTEQLSRRSEEFDLLADEKSRTEEQLQFISHHDPLTSLPNRRLFLEQLTLILKLNQRNQRHLGLLLINIDQFARINESLGHAAGDLILRECSERICSSLRDSDLVHRNDGATTVIDVSRIGGDEFTVVLSQIVDGADAEIVAQRLLRALAQPIVHEDSEVFITASIGIALAPEHAQDVEGLVRAAGAAVQAAKHAGNNGALVYQPDMKGSDRRRLELESALRRALETGEGLSIHYQPQVNTRTASVDSAEALIRWNHPEHGALSPAVYLPLAEKLGLMPALGEWVLRQACRDLAALHGQGIMLEHVSVNVSPLQLRAGFADSVAAILEETGVRPNAIVLELTEGILIANDATSLTQIVEIAAMGVELAIDDFGTGYSSLSYLTRFPLGELKIDRSFITNVTQDPQQQELVRAILAMAAALQMKVVVEGVETSEQYAFLRQHGAHVIQGFLFSKPLPIERLTPMLAPKHYRQQINALEVELETPIENAS